MIIETKFNLFILIPYSYYNTHAEKFELRDQKILFFKLQLASINYSLSNNLNKNIILMNQNCQLKAPLCNWF